MEGSSQQAYRSQCCRLSRIREQITGLSVTAWLWILFKLGNNPEFQQKVPHRSHHKDQPTDSWTWRICATSRCIPLLRRSRSHCWFAGSQQCPFRSENWQRPPKFRQKLRLKSSLCSFSATGLSPSNKIERSLEQSGKTWTRTNILASTWSKQPDNRGYKKDICWHGPQREKYQNLQPKKQSMVLKMIPGWIKIIIIFIKSVPSWALLRISVNVVEKNLVLIVLGFGTPQEFRVQLLVLAWVWLLPLLSALVFCPHFEKRNSPVVHCARFSSILLPVAKLSVKLHFLCEATEGKYIVCKFSTFQPMLIKYLDFDGLECQTGSVNQHF